MRIFVTYNKVVQKKLQLFNTIMLGCKENKPPKSDHLNLQRQSSQSNDFKKVTISKMFKM